MQSAVHYNPRGYEATLDEGGDSCSVAVRGFKYGDGFVERGGPSHQDDRVLARFTIRRLGVQEPFGTSANVRDTFIDTLADRRDLLGNPDFRHKPAGDSERRLFAAAYDAAQKIRSKMSVLGYDKLVFTLVPSAFSVVDCFARDVSGAFWLMSATDRAAPFVGGQTLPVAAYALERGGYVPGTASIRLGVWRLSPAGATFEEVPNNRVAVRDIIIDGLCEPPF